MLGRERWESLLMGTRKAVITVNRPRQEVEHRWHEQHPDGDGIVSFREAPADHGTEIQLEVPGTSVPLKGGLALAKARDHLRHFKALVETGEIARSDAAPEGERVQRKFKQRPAQPLRDDELQKAGV
jgi:hypothetical protein